MLDRRTPPPFVHSTSFDLIKPKTAVLSNGSKVFLIPGGDQEVIKVELVYEAGRWVETMRGASHFSANLLTKGTFHKTSFEIAQTLDRFGAHIEIQPGLDFVSVSIYSLTQYLEPVLELFVELMLESSFPEREIEQSKSIFIQNLKVNEEKTSFLASKAFRKNLFGTNHPYGWELEESDVNALEQRYIINHFESFYNKPSIFVSGKISLESEKIILDLFNKFKSTTTSEPTLFKSITSTFNKKVSKDGSVQATIRAGRKSIQRNHEHYPEAVFAIHLLGGYFGSRLMKNIREEKGLTYGIYASLHPLQKESYLVIGADVNKENVDLTLDEIRKEIKTLRTENISDDELLTAKNHFIGSLQSEITTPFAHADKIKTIVLSGLDDHFYERMIERIDTITAEKIISVIEQHFHEDTLNAVSVG